MTPDTRQSIEAEFLDAATRLARVQDQYDAINISILEYMEQKGKYLSLALTAMGKLCLLNIIVPKKIDDMGELLIQANWQNGTVTFNYDFAKWLGTYGVRGCSEFLIHNRHLLDCKQLSHQHRCRIHHAQAYRSIVKFAEEFDFKTPFDPPTSDLPILRPDLLEKNFAKENENIDLSKLTISDWEKLIAELKEMSETDQRQARYYRTALNEAKRRLAKLTSSPSQ